MKKRTKVLAALTLVCLGIGGIIMEFTLNGGMGLIVTEKEKQIAYLKDHEQDIVDFVKSQNDKIKSVQIDWDDVRWGNGMAFEKTEYIHLYGTINDNKELDWHIRVSSENSKVVLGSMMIVEPIDLEGE